ncbi:hypothetical protein BgiMline_036495, partial [Biomphalaria glabrata]
FNPLLMTYTKTIHTIRADFAAYIAIVVVLLFAFSMFGEGLALVKHMSFQIENAALMHTLSILLPFIITPDNSKR